MKILLSFFALSLLITTSHAGTQPPEYWYDVKDGFYYGYEAVESPKLVMARYLGERKGISAAIVKEDQEATVYFCKPNCKHIKVLQFWQRELIEETMLKMVDGSIAWEIFQDIWNGKLERYQRESDGKYLWADKSGPQWTDQ